MNAILSRLIDKCIRHGIIKDQETDVYRYGFDLLVFSLINIILLVFVGLAVNRAGSVALILLGYIPLQSMGGGYHADTHLRCMLLMLFDMGIALFAVEFANRNLLIAGACIGIIIIFLLAPVQHPSAPFGINFAKRMKGLVRVYSTIIFVAMFFSMKEYKTVSSCMATSIILSSFSLCGAMIKSKCIQNKSL